jgi:hypothetical protein
VLMHTNLDAVTTMFSLSKGEGYSGSLDDYKALVGYLGNKPSRSSVENRANSRQSIDEPLNQSPNTTTALSHGGNPYGYCYTSSKSCSSRCSEIKVSANRNSGTIVIIKQKEEVVRCAYIDKGRTFTFKLPNGTYTPYFYSGTGWSNKKYMKTTTQCGRLYGGFTAGESVGKDTPQTLNNQILSYDLNTQFDGNFQTKSSDVSEAF